MRIALFFLLLLVAATGHSQRQLPPTTYRVRFASETVFKKPAPPKTMLPQITERAAAAMGLCNVSCAPLPATFLSLKAERKSELQVAVKWETANEYNCQGYQVERSLGDASHFEAVGFVQAAVNNPLPKYTFIDQNDFSGTSYYRLKQFDNDQKYRYSKTVSVNGYPKDEALEGYPNPAHATLQVTLSVKQAGTADLLLFDASGRLLQQQTRALAKGGNLFALDVQPLSPGFYFIRVMTPANQPLSFRFLKN